MKHKDIKERDTEERRRERENVEYSKVLEKFMMFQRPIKSYVRPE